MAKQTKSLTLSSDFDEIQRVESFVDELQDWISFDDEIYGNVMLALSEAVTNAIVHGNKQDSDKKVHIKASQNNQKLTISIKDEGEGFDPSSLPDPLQDENLLKEGGRGVYLIEQFADEVTYSEDGTKITVRFLV
ncbi:ATP-binding protein [Aliifodinibius sp. S!AR15-10]|uniref:ATP-binding protein n=1 Tax=Aliifodinibius sp. S!AR15-10 TaxID=2950437 RepID=UPI00286527FB|nr:ATP-binding protein [Aliifodinibius sp. S!AR15-10]MDR8392763.1 ATP-binding protein [Aliifodinibius sp. S!AR15-10]